MSIILKPGDSGEEVKCLQRALNEKACLSISTDGVFGNGTKNAMMAWQKQNKFDTDGIYDSDKYTALADLINTKYIRFSELDKYAKAIGIDSAILKAITEVECKGNGFFTDGSCTILFERHIFFNQVTQKFGSEQAQQWSIKYPNICFETRSQSAYFGGKREWERVNLAKNLDPECALLSTSFGMFQIMGFNYKICGYSNVGEYVSDMIKSEKYQVGAVSMYIKNYANGKLYKAVTSLDFNEIARLFNGNDYAVNNYNGKLKDAYKKFNV